MTDEQFEDLQHHDVHPYDFVAMNNVNFASLDPVLATDAVDYLRQAIPAGEHAAIRAEMVADPQTWWAPYHMLWGMSVRNMLRAKGFGEKDFKIDNLDDYYIALVERAVAE